MGPGEKAPPLYLQLAYQLGGLIAAAGWVTLCGGRNAGVMEAVSRGAHEHQGLTIGILPDAHPDAVSPFIDIPVLTGMGSARNNINVLTSQVVVACGMGAGTLSEIALAIKARKPVILLGYPPEDILFLQKIEAHNQIRQAESAAEVIAIIKEILNL